MTDEYTEIGIPIHFRMPVWRMDDDC